jgi:methionyl-tRNA formyltransferase
VSASRSAFNRVILLGDGQWAETALDHLASHGQLLAIVTRRSPTDAGFVSKVVAGRLPHRSFDSINSEEAICWIRELEPDLLLSVSYDQLFRKPVFDLGLPVYNVHAGHPSRVRGRAVLTWQLIEGRQAIDLVAMRAVLKVDAGPVLAQREVRLESNAGYARALASVAQAVPDLLDEALAHSEPEENWPDLSGAIYYPRRIAGDEWIDWSWPAERVSRFIRALEKPNPIARTRLHQQELRVCACSPGISLSASAGIAGCVIDRSQEEGILVRCGQGAIWLRELMLGSGEALPLSAIHLSDRLTGVSQPMVLDECLEASAGVAGSSSC